MRGEKKLRADHKLFIWQPQTRICPSVSSFGMMRTMNFNTCSCLLSGEISTRPNHRAIFEFTFEVLCNINGNHRVCLRVHVYVCVSIEHTVYSKRRYKKEAALKSDLRSVFLLQAINTGTKFVSVGTLGHFVMLLTNRLTLDDSNWGKMIVSLDSRAFLEVKCVLTMTMCNNNTQYPIKHEGLFLMYIMYTTHFFL